MDEQVKARLIGATVLVVIAVALVPELLSGPKRDAAGSAEAGKRGTRTHVVDLSGAVAGAARMQPVAPPTTSAPREDSRLPTVEVPGAAAERGGDDEPSPGTLPPIADATPAPAATVASSEPPAPMASPAKTNTTGGSPAAVAPKSAVPAQGGWAVQVGAFGSAASARRLVRDLEQDGLSAYVAPLNRHGKTLHRVRVGPEATRADADALATRIKRKGLPAAVVAAD